MSRATLRPWMPSNPRWIARLLAVSMAGSAALLGGAILFAWSGLYDIAASGGHWKVVERFLEFGMRSSVKTNAAGIEAPRLDNPGLIRLGAGHFHRGCAFCHGAPGMPVNPIAEQMLPSPPDLSISMRPWKERELFWIVKHGFKYTGMPGWVALERDDEIWAVVAFLTALPALDAESYRGLALGDVRLSPRSGSELATSESNPEAVSACARCHGGDGQRPMSNLVPVLHGQPAEFLVSALNAYAEGKRRSGIMQPLAADLRAEDIQNIAEYYAGLSLPRAEVDSKDEALIERGRKLALEGAPEAGIPPCMACHGNPGGAAPRLAGQHAAYLTGQLQLWRAGLVPTTAGAALMAPVAQHLSDEQIKALSAYFATAQPHVLDVLN
jgi:cytochrome c553